MVRTRQMTTLGDGVAQCGGSAQVPNQRTTKRRHRRLERSTPKGVRPGGRSTADPADDKIGTRSWHGVAPSCFIFSLTTTASWTAPRASTACSAHKTNVKRLITGARPLSLLLTPLSQRSAACTRCDLFQSPPVPDPAVDADHAHFERIITFAILGTLFSLAYPRRSYCSAARSSAPQRFSKSRRR